MRKYIFLVIFIFSISPDGNAFFGDPSSLDLYTNIDKGIIELEDKILEIELNGGVGSEINTKINALASLDNITPCLRNTPKINISDIKEIVEFGNTSKIITFMKADCKNDLNNSVSINLFKDYINLFRKHYYNSQKNSIKKTKQIYKISNIGIYSDGILENSGFDIITDIENINNIIFSNQDNYEGGEKIKIEEEIQKKTVISNKQPSKYNKVTDSFPCKDFFCIIIKSVKYDHSGSSTNTDDKSIEFLINRSNKHLSEHAVKFLGQSKMTTGLFELGLKDLNIPNLLHLSIQVSYKPVPILDIEKKDKKDKSEFSGSGLLEKFYDAHSLNYSRRNDLSKLRSSEIDKKSTLNSQSLNILNIAKNISEYDNKYKIIQQNKIEILNKSIDKKVSYGITENFEKQYTEIHKFTTEIENYTEKLHSILKEMLKIPVNK